MKTLDYTSVIWWKRLSQQEKNILIEMLYKMDGEEFRQYGICIDDFGNYVKRDEEDEI